MPEPRAEPLRDRPESWPVSTREDIWHGPAPFSVRRDLVSRPDGAGEGQFGRLVLEHPGAAVVLAVDADERVLVLHQYRHPAGIRFVEVPAGLLDVAGEDPLETARRELREEGLLVAATWTHLLTTYPSPGLSSERIEIYLAEDVSAAPDRGGFEPEHEEADMTVSWVPMHELLAAVIAGDVTHGPMSLSVLAYAMRNSQRPL